jgi:hypothetical protein
MIFTGQENIDDIIFFPMMRPSVSHLNAQIYEIHEPALAPVEDLALSATDFEALCRDGALKPQTTHLTIKPHLRVWPGGRAFGHVDVDSFFANSVLRLTGYKLDFSKPLSDDEAKQKFMDSLESSLLQILRKTFPQCQITVSPLTLMHGS